MLVKKGQKLMGNHFEFGIITESEQSGSAIIRLAIQEVKRIEEILTTFSETSVTNLINTHAGISPVEVPDEVFQLISRCQKISNLTQGAFDITYGSIDKSLWNFDIHMTSLPNPEIAKKSVQLINFKNIRLDLNAQTVFLVNKGMRIGFGGIGKGYAADRAAHILKSNGAESGFVNAAGDIKAWGYQENGSPWTIGVADPNQKQKVFSSIDITNTAVATSGDYEKFVMIDGKRYSHTIDPKTGLPVTGIKSVTIITSQAELADALATPVMVMGINSGLHLINQIKGVGCIVIDDKDSMFTSNNIKLK
ncbi:MAG: FAD:protein FMN transferase [Saprospiraceae bacterium]